MDHCLRLPLLTLLVVILTCLPDLSLQNQYCSINKQHTLCKYQGVGPKCKIPHERGIPSADRNLIMDMHNSFRSMVATGNERRGKPGPQPTARNMKQMVWDEELAATAQRLADQCRYQHDCLECRKVSRFLTGQNLYQFSENIVRPGADWNTAIRAWYDEVADWSPRHIEKFHFIKPLGHFTQMLWAETYTIGCGYSYFNDGKWNRKLYICNYGPTGNIITLPMYEFGAPCSACPEGTSCSGQYPGLCAPGGGRSYRPSQAVATVPPPPPTIPPSRQVFVSYAPPAPTTPRYTTTYRTTTTTPRPTTRYTTTYAPPTKSTFSYTEIDNNELFPFENRFNYRKQQPADTSRTKYYTKATTEYYNPHNFYETTSTRPVQFTEQKFNNFNNRFSSINTLSFTTSRPAANAITYQPRHTFPTTPRTTTYRTTTTTTTPRPTTAITFSPRIYPENGDSRRILNTNTNYKIENRQQTQGQRYTPSVPRPAQNEELQADQAAETRIFRTFESPVSKVRNQDSILLFCDFDYAKCPIRFTGDSWNYTEVNTPGFGRGFETVVEQKHATNLYIRSIMHPAEDGNICLQFRYIVYPFEAAGGPGTNPVALGSDGKPISLRVTAGTLKQQPKIVEISQQSKHSRDWLTTSIQFRNLKSMFLLIFQLPSNFLEDYVYIAIDDVLVTQGLCSS